MTELKIISSAFETEGWMPNRNSGYGEDFSPEIHIDGMDANAVSIVITLDDLGHPIHPGYNHWVAWNIPPINVLPEHLPKGAVCEQPFHIEQGLAYGKHCYRGPKPHSTGITDIALQSVFLMQCWISVRIQMRKQYCSPWKVTFCRRGFCMANIKRSIINKTGIIIL